MKETEGEEVHSVNGVHRTEHLFDSSDRLTVPDPRQLGIGAAFSIVKQTLT